MEKNDFGSLDRERKRREIFVPSQHLQNPWEPLAQTPASLLLPINDAHIKLSPHINRLAGRVSEGISEGELCTFSRQNITEA